MDTSKILQGLLTKAYKLPEADVARIFEEYTEEEKALAALLNLDADRVKKIKGASTGDRFDEGYNKGKAEALQTLNTELRETYNIESDKEGAELISEIVSQASKASTELTEADIKRHAIYQGMEKTFKKRLAETEKEAEAKIQAFKKEQERATILFQAKQKAGSHLDALNPILPKSTIVANTIKEGFYKELEGYDFEKQEDGSFLVLKGGKVLEDQHGHSVPFETLINSVAEKYFEFHENNGGGNAGNKKKVDPTEGVNITTFKNEQEAVMYANDVKIPLEQRMKALEEYNKSKVI